LEISEYQGVRDLGFGTVCDVGLTPSIRRPFEEWLSSIRLTIKEHKKSVNSRTSIESNSLNFLMASAIINVAILDDYQNVATHHFSLLMDSHQDKFRITTFSETLPAFNLSSTSIADKDKLVQRLKPFNIISTMRERTPFPAELLRALPNLKLLLTTGTRNLAIDMGVAKELGVAVAGAPGLGRK
jgi:hypothetical protein